MSQPVYSILASWRSLGLRRLRPRYALRPLPIHTARPRTSCSQISLHRSVRRRQAAKEWEAGNRSTQWERCTSRVPDGSLHDCKGSKSVRHASAAYAGGRASIGAIYPGYGSKIPIGHEESTQESSQLPIVLNFDVENMACASCVSSVKKIVEHHPAVSEASVSLLTATAKVNLRTGITGDGNTNVAKIVQSLENSLAEGGYPAKSTRDWSTSNHVPLLQILSERRQQRENKINLSTMRLLFACAMAYLCIVGHVSYFALSYGWLTDIPLAAKNVLHFIHSDGLFAVLSLVSILGPGRGMITEGFQMLLRGSPNVGSLVGLGALGSYGISMAALMYPQLHWHTYFDEPVMLLAFVLLGKYLEERAKLQAGSDLYTLAELLPRKARVLRSACSNFKNEDLKLMISNSVEMDVSSIRPGDLAIVFAGETVPVDGQVIDGEADVIETSISGEPVPVLRRRGDIVSACTTTCNGSLIVKVLRCGEDAMVSQIAREVVLAQEKQAPVQRIVDKVSGQFAWGVIATAFLTLGFWEAVALLHPQALTGWNRTSQLSGSIAAAPIDCSLGLRLASSVLVVACPCALGLATPTALLVGTSYAARRGILIRGGEVLERLTQVDTVVFDKTGTLTSGKPVVTHMALHNDLHRDTTKMQQETLSLVGALAQRSKHPIAAAVLDAVHWHSPHRKFPSLRKVHETPGGGISGFTSQGTLVALGRLKWLEQVYGKEFQVDKEGHRDNQASTFFCTDGIIRASFDIEDRVRDNAAQTVAYIQRRGMETWMLSGDNRNAALLTGQKVGIPQERILSEVDPAGKAEHIAALQLQQMRSKKRVVAMVGDGINDAKALKVANVGVAMGAGAPLSANVSPIVLLRDDLHLAAEAFAIAKTTMGKVYQNLAWTFGYNIVCIPLAAGVLLPFTGLTLTPSIASALMGISSVSVVLNSLTIPLSSLSPSPKNPIKPTAKDKKTTKKS